MSDEDLQPVSAPTATKIVDAAGQLFMQRGYKAVSIADIIKAAEVTKPTLYYHFAHKEELFVQMGLRVMAEMGGRLQAAVATPGSLAGRLQAIAAVLMADQNNNMGMLRHEMFEHLWPAQRSRLARAFYLHLFSPILRVMEDGINAGELARYPPVTLTRMFMGMAESFLEFTSHTGEPESAQHEPLFGADDLDPPALVDLFLHGVGATPGASPHRRATL